MNPELSVLRQLLTHAKLGCQFTDDYRPLENTKPPAGQALTDDEQARLFEVAKSNPGLVLRVRGRPLDFFCGLRACEIKALQWKHIAWEDRRLSVRPASTTSVDGATTQCRSPT